MNFLLDNPIVLGLAEWVWGEDEAVNPKACLNTLPFMLTPCWSGLFVKGIGVAIILAACINKLPVILNMMESKSAAGISATAVYGETIVYANCAAYGWLNGHPVTAWGENFGLLVQSLAITCLMWQFTTATDAANSTRQQALTALLAMLLYCSVTYTMPQSYYYLLMTTVVPILLYSRGMQILETMRCQHTGAQSIVTVGLNLLGGLVRIGTTIKEVGLDMAVLGTYVLSCALNFAMFLQYFYYKTNTEKFLADLKVATAEKKES